MFIKALSFMREVSPPLVSKAPRAALWLFSNSFEVLQVGDVYISIVLAYCLHSVTIVTFSGPVEIVR